MKKSILLFVFCLTFGLLNAQQHDHFRNDAKQGLYIENSDFSGLSLRYTINEISLPNLPFENQYIAVPKNATVRIEVKENATTTLHDIDLLPAVFGKDAAFPQENVTIAQATCIRGLDVVLLNITPFRYDPIRKTLEVIYDMDIEVRFEGGDSQFCDTRYLHPDWNNLLRNLVINSDMLPESDYYDFLNEALQKGQEGCEYLIISPDDEEILAWADTLKRFRTQQGILTRVVSTTECGGNTPTTIKRYIQNAYENWVIPPATLMIFGGYEDSLFYVNSDIPDTVSSKGIPGFPLVFLHYANEDDIDYYLSDNPYADMNGDSIPDMAISRMPANTLEEYQTQVEKLIQYETNPPTDPLFYDHPVITSCYEDRTWFMITSQSVDGFFRKKLEKHPSNLYSIYMDQSTIPDSAWSQANYTDVAVNYYGPHGENYIPQSIGELHDWIYYYDNQPLIDALNQGSFFTMFRGHAATYWWAAQTFMTENIYNLQNTDPNFVLSIGCNTARFEDSYISYPGYGFWDRKPILSAFCNQRPGALGGIGAVTVTRSQYNDILTWGFLDYIWPEFMSTLGSSSNPDFARPSYALVAGKLFLTQNAFIPGWWPSKITDTHNVFHYLGEAYLSLNTEAPQPMSLDIPLTFKFGSTQYSLTAEEGASICLSRDGEIMKVGKATGSPQSFDIPEIAVGERFHVTVTKQNRIRSDQNVICIVADEPFVRLQEAVVKGQTQTGHLPTSDITSIDLVLKNDNDVASQSARVTLTCSSPLVDIIKGTAKYAPIPPFGTTTLENAFQVNLRNGITDQSPIVFEIHFNEGQNTHSDSFTATVDAPILQIEPEFTLCDEQGKPTTHLATEGKSTVTFHITNTGHAESDLVSAQLTVKAPFVETESGSTFWGTVPPGEGKDLAFEVVSDGTDMRPAWLQASLDIQHGSTHITKDTLLQYSGIFENFETDTLNPYFRWTNTGNHKWTYCEESPYEGTRCLMSNATSENTSRLRATLLEPYVNHPCKISFFYKTGANDTLSYSNTNNGYHAIGFTAEEWQYAEALYNGDSKYFSWSYRLNNDDDGQGYLDNLCFPPLHRMIVHAGGNSLHCGTHPFTLHDAYAYDCESVFWTTEGDGSFDDESKVNPTYFWGPQDLLKGNVVLTLHAIDGPDTIVSSTQVRFVDNILLGEIQGDTMVFPNVAPVSHYAVDFQEGVKYAWVLEPATAGNIYGQGNEIDIVWNPYGNNNSVLLSVIPDNGCEADPATISISMINTAVDQWKASKFWLFPNPTDGIVNLILSDDSQGKTVVEVFNILGDRLFAQSDSNPNQNRHMTLDLSRFAPGIYIIKLSTSQGSWSKKVSIK